MDILIAIGHIIGAFIISAGVGIVILFISSWEQKRNHKAALDELAVKIGVPRRNLEDEEMVAELMPKVIEVSREKFSEELLINRLSDFCGVLRTTWYWLGNILQVVFFLGVIWHTATGDLSNAINVWFINAIIILFFIVGVSFSLLCKLITGRYPGQAKQARQFVINYINNQ